MSDKSNQQGKATGNKNVNQVADVDIGKVLVLQAKEPMSTYAFNVLKDTLETEFEGKEVEFILLPFKAEVTEVKVK